MTVLHTVLLITGGSVLLLGLFSNLLKRWGVPEPLLLLLLGVALGPQGAGLLNPRDWGRQEVLLEEAARLALAIGLMGVALRLPRNYLPRAWRSLAVVLGLGMLAMWLSSSVLVGIIVGVPLWTALLIGALVTPTDPIVASAIVTGEVAEKNLPADLRNLLSAESGANDGLALPFVLLPALLLTRTQGEAIQHWLGRVLLWEVGIAIVAGGLIGYVMGWLLMWGERRKLVEEPSIIAFTTALALFTLAAIKLIGADGVLAVFVAGLGFDRVVDAGQRTTEERVVEGVDRFFTLPIFVLLGLMLPWDEWNSLGWRAAALAVAVLLLRRLPLFLVLAGRLSPLPRLADALFLGWFGPIGVAAVFYAGLAMRRAGVHDAWSVASLLACASIAAHGLTATPLTRLYGRRAALVHE